MELQGLSQEEIKLVERAKKLAKDRKSEISETSAVIKTSSGKIYEGVNMMFDMLHPISICAEYSATAQMVTADEKEIETIAIARYRNSRFDIPTPCGKCRQLLSYFGNPNVIIEIENKLKKVKLKDLLPLAYNNKS